MSYSILLVVKKPSLDNTGSENQWIGYRRNLEGLAGNNKAIEILGENILLLPLDQDLSVLSKIHGALMGLPYKYTIFDEDIRWVEVATDKS
jgi:hypothetical protein